MIRTDCLFLPCADAAIFAGKVGRILPEVTVRALVDMDLATENRVSRHGCLPLPKMCHVCKDCETAAGPEEYAKI